MILQKMEVKMTKYPISSDLIVACKIHELSEENGLVDFGILVESLNGIISRTTISNSLNTLADWGIIRTEYGMTSKGRAGRLYKISGESKKVIKETYDRFWKFIIELHEREQQDEE